MKLRRRKRDSRGVALLMVLSGITILTIFLTELQEDGSAGLSAAIAERDGLKAEYHARSAINLSRLLIATEPTIRKAVQPFFMAMGKKNAPQIPVWAFTDLVLGQFNCPEGTDVLPEQVAVGDDADGGPAPAPSTTTTTTTTAALNVDPSTAQNVGLPPGQCFHLKIVDEDSKININNAAKDETMSTTRLAAELISLTISERYDTIFESRDLDDQISDRATICGAIVDWADPNENGYVCDPQATGPSNSSVEDNYYPTIGLPYLRKNAAFDSLEELHLVRGVGDDFWSTFVDPEPEKPEKRVLTVWGQGAVNVNSANALTILAIVCAGAPDAKVCTDVTQMESFISTVSILKALTQGAPLFNSPGEFVSAMKGKGQLASVFAMAGLEPITFKSDAEVKKMIATDSKVFSIYADGIVTGYKKQIASHIHAVVDFRTAKPIGDAQTSLFGSSTSSTQSTGFGTSSGLGTTSASGSSATTQPTTPEQLAQILASNPAGSVIYWRVE